MREFKCEYHRCDNSVELYSKDHQKLTCTSDPNTDAGFMSVNDPAVLAAFVAFCSKKERKVFLRGCTNNYERSVPSLFRIDSCKECDEPARGERWSNYQDLLAKLRSNLKGDRWESERLGAILQHYGIRTPWLDVCSRSPYGDLVCQSRVQEAWILSCDSGEQTRIRMDLRVLQESEGTSERTNSCRSLERTNHRGT